MRIGQGFDAHRFASHDAGKPLWLACLRWDGDGIEGDSDGDVAAHALIDALLSAAGLGDIGMLFGVGSDSAGAGKHGDEMLRATVAYLRAHGMRPVSASVVVVANRPKIGKRRDEAQQALSHAIGCEVSLTATTTDGMGFTGRARASRPSPALGGTDRLILSLPAACRFDYFGDNPEQCGNRHDDEARGSGEHGGNQQPTPNGDQTDHGGDDHRGERGP